MERASGTPSGAPRILRAEFETSAADPSGWPAAVPDRDGDSLPDEIAFVGRSNVGKSSLLNTLVGRKGLARTSAEPGRTRLVNFFLVEIAPNPDGQAAHPARRLLRFVDLPGFGYARVSKSERATWRPAIERYLSGRQALRAVVLLVDARRVPAHAGPPARSRTGPTSAEEAESLVDEEHALLDWIAARGVEVIPVITKSDKLAKHERALVADRLKRIFGRPVVLASALSPGGGDRLWARLLASLGASPASLTTSDPSD